MFKTARVAKNNHNSLHLARKYIWVILAKFLFCFFFFLRVYGQRRSRGHLGRKSLDTAGGSEGAR